MTSLAQKQTPDFTTARYNMVECQLRPNKITDERVLAAMENLPREMFVPPTMAGVAYMDSSLQVAPGRYLLEPMIQARLIQAAAITSDDKVMDVAALTGYSTVILASMAKEVVAIEPEPILHSRAAVNISSLGKRNAEIKLVPLAQGWKTSAPYNVILINGAVDAVPESLFEQLAEGGRLLAIVRHYGAGQVSHTGKATLFEKIRGSLSSRPLFDANVALLPGFQASPTFVF